jgi:hypothetical protein
MRKHLSNRAREALWCDSRCHDASGKLEEFPRCNIPGCGGFVTPGQKWVESHYPIPAAHGGEATGVAHHRCNFLYWREVEAPMMAHVTRERQKHIGAYRARHPMPGGRGDPRKRTMAGKVVDRRTGKLWKGYRNQRTRDVT